MCYLCVSAKKAIGEHEQHFDISSEIGTRTQAFTSSTPYIAALLDGLSWTGTTGQAATITYNFTSTVEGGALFNAAQQAGALAAMQEWANVANINFVASSNADLTFSQENLGGTTVGLASTFFTGETILSSEVQIDDSVNSVNVGSFGFLVLLHEIGHALGLKHPGNYSAFDVGPFLSSEEDTIQTTVMSYNNSTLVNENNNPPVTPMIYDIAAVQELYGANSSYMSGNNFYNFDGSVESITLWDAGGDDTMSAASYQGGGASLNLNSGSASQIGHTVAYLGFGVNIENAVGTTGNDTLTGDDDANEIFGGNGQDSISGGGGNDTIYGGDGIVDSDDDSDTISGDNGADFIVGNTGDDVLYGGVGIADSESSSDTIYGGFGRDEIYGNAGDDSLYGGGATADPNDLADTIAGGKGSDYIIANGGNDIIYGGGAVADPGDSNDTIYAGVGDDSILGNGGNDYIVGGPGNDQMHGGLGDDIYVFTNDSGIDIIEFFEGAGTSGGDIIQIQSDINGSGITSGQAAVDAITVAGDGSAVLLLGGTNLLTIQGVGSSLTADDFQII